MCVYHDSDFVPSCGLIRKTNNVTCSVTSSFFCFPNVTSFILFEVGDSFTSNEIIQTRDKNRVHSEGNIDKAVCLLLTTRVETEAHKNDACLKEYLTIAVITA